MDQRIVSRRVEDGIEIVPELFLRPIFRKANAIPERVSAPLRGQPVEEIARNPVVC